MSLCPVSCVCAAAKLEDASFDHIPSASRPSSPDTQLAATSPGQGAELSREEAATYSRWGDGGECECLIAIVTTAPGTSRRS